MIVCIDCTAVQMRRKTEILMIDRNGEKEIYLQLYEHLKGLIVSGELGRKHKFPSIRALMKQHNLSSASVTRAVNMLCDDNLLKSLPKRGYIVIDQSSEPAKAPKKSKDIIAFVTEKHVEANSISDDPVFTKIFGYIEAEAAKRQYDLLQVFLDPGSPAGLSRFERLMDKVDGVLMGYYVHARYLRIAKRKGVPVVGIHAASAAGSDSIGIDNVTVNRADAFFKAASHLLNLGHSKIFYLDGWRDGGTKIRYSGITSAYAEASLPPPPNNVLITNGWSSEHSRSLVEEMALEELPSAFICSNDTLALGVIKGLNERGLCIPDDISIIGAKNTILSEIAIPAMTTIDYMDEEIAKMAVKTVHERIDGDTAPPFTISFSAKLVDRASCQKPRVEKPMAVITNDG